MPALSAFMPVKSEPKSNTISSLYVLPEVNTPSPSPQASVAREFVAGATASAAAAKSVVRKNFEFLILLIEFFGANLGRKTMRAQHTQFREILRTRPLCGKQNVARNTQRLRPPCPSPRWWLAWWRRVSGGLGFVAKGWWWAWVGGGSVVEFGLVEGTWVCCGRVGYVAKA